MFFLVFSKCSINKIIHEKRRSCNYFAEILIAFSSAIVYNYSYSVVNRNGREEMHVLEEEDD